MTQAALNPAVRREEQAGMMADANETQFWQQLIDAHWEKNSVAFDRIPASLWRLDAQDVYRLLTWCGEHMADSEVRYFLHRSDQTVWQLYTKPRPEVLPTKADGSLARYHERMRREVASGSGYSIFVNEVIKNDEVAWRAVRDFVRGLVQRIGLPTRGFDSGVGLGQYDFTPFGLHVDPGRSAFVLPVAGKKHFRIWPAAYIRQHRELIRARGDYGPLVKDSVMVEAGPGGLLYWPSDAWHIAEGANDGEFNAMVAIGALLGPPNGVQAVPCDVDNLQENAQRLPDGLAAALEGTFILKRAPTLEQVWVGFLSGLGLRYPIPVRQDALPQGRLQIQQRYPLISRPLSDHQLAIGVNGHCIVESGEWLTGVVERINSGEPFEAGELASDSTRGPVVHKLLGRLWECGALESHA